MNQPCPINDMAPPGDPARWTCELDSTMPLSSREKAPRTPPPQITRAEQNLF